MLLETFLKENEMSAADFAQEIGVSAEAIRLYLAGKRIPSKNTMRRIMDSTGGEVQPNDFYAAA